MKKFPFQALIFFVTLRLMFFPPCIILVLIVKFSFFFSRLSPYISRPLNTNYQNSPHPPKLYYTNCLQPRSVAALLQTSCFDCFYFSLAFFKWHRMGMSALRALERPSASLLSDTEAPTKEADLQLHSASLYSTLKHAKLSEQIL